MRGCTRAIVLLAATLLCAAGCRNDGPVPLGDPGAWSAHPADGVELALVDDAGALRLDFTFHGGGYAIARREVDLTLPANYAFRFRLRGEGPPNHLEFKLIDDSGENVWWHVEHDVTWPADWTTVRIRRRQVRFAWGPLGGGDPGHVAAIEFAVTAGAGGSGSVWIDGLELWPLPVAAGPPPPLVAAASSAAPGRDAALALDGDRATSWAPAAGDTAPQFLLDLGPEGREFSALTLHWAPGPHSLDYAVAAIAPGDPAGAWTRLRVVSGSNGGRDDLFLPESEATRLRVTLRVPAHGPVPALTELELHPVDWAPDRNAFFGHLAAAAARGLYPRGFLGEPSAWTVVGVDRDTREGLLGADGALEVGPGEFSLEPFLRLDGNLVGWADVTAGQDLAIGAPVPRVVWSGADWALTVTAAGVGAPEASSLLAVYAFENRGKAPRTVILDLALRPFQVNPPTQFLNIRGGTASIGRIARQGHTLRVDGRARVRFSPAPDRFGAATFAAGDAVAEHLARGALPSLAEVDDPFGAASAVASWDLDVPAGGRRLVAVIAPLHGDPPTDGDPVAADAAADLLRAAAGAWPAAGATADARTVRLGPGMTIAGPPAAAEALRTLQAQLGWILVNRAGVRIQPGARAYARSWIRDGALTGEALLRLDRAADVRDFLTWFAPYQYASGKIPCVVDGRGADPVPEHDSTGEFIYLVAEYCRYTGDDALRDAMWPRVLAGVGYLESLLAERRTAVYADPARREFYGILPPSISHEGYAAKPMHSYWDDFFTLRGLRDAAGMAADLVAAGADSLAAERDRLAALRDTFAADLAASIAAAMTRHDIDYVPGCADLGDFDATSTTIALDPAAAGSLLPPGALEATFTRYWEFFDGRRNGEPWDAFTPYEVRTIGAMTRLGWRDRAQAALAFFLEHRTPAGWRQWAEVVGHDPRRARFIGDMPHTWVGSDFVRSCLDLFWYEERETAGEEPVLVLAAGVPAGWLDAGGVAVTGLRTPWGRLGYRLWREGGTVNLEIDAGTDIPPGGLRLAPPVAGPARLGAGGEAPRDAAGRVVVRRVPARVTWVDSGR